MRRYPFNLELQACSRGSANVSRPECLSLRFRNPKTFPPLHPKAGVLSTQTQAPRSCFLSYPYAYMLIY